MKIINLILFTFLITLILLTSSSNAVLVTGSNLSYQHTYNDTDSQTRIGSFVDYFNTGTVPTGWTNETGKIVTISGGKLIIADSSTSGSLFRTSGINITSGSVSSVMRVTGTGATNRNGLVLFRRSSAISHYDAIVWNTTSDVIRIRKRVSDSSTTLGSDIATTAPTLNVDYNYVFLANGSSGLYFKFWQVGTAEPNWLGIRTDATFINGTVGYWIDGLTLTADNFSLRNVVNSNSVNVGNVTGVYDFGSGFQGSQMAINYTLGESNTSVDAYASTDNVTWTLVSTGISSGTLTNIPLAAKNQTQYIRATLNGGNATSPNFINMSVTSEATTSPSTTIIIPANSWVMFNNWTYNTNFSRISANESNDVAYSWYNIITGDFDSFYVGNTYGQSIIIPKNNSVFGFFNTQTSIIIPVMTPVTTDIANGWNMMYVEGSSNRTLSEIKNDMESSLCNDLGLYKYNTTLSNYSSSLSESLQPNEGFLVYIDGGCTWTRSTI